MESQGLWFGLMLAPRQTWRNFLCGRHSRNYFHEKFPGDVFAQTVGDLRARLLPPAPEKIKPTFGDVVAFVGSSVLGLCAMVVFTPIVIFFTIVGLVVR